MNTTSPDARGWSRRLTRAWSLLAALTILSLGLTLGAGRVEAGTAAAAAVLVLAYFKAGLVLDHFLDLKSAGPGWRGFFAGMLILVLGGLMAAYAAAAVLAR